MTQTYARLQKQIASLQAEAQRLKKAEVSEVIVKIKEAISVYGLTIADLFPGAFGKRPRTKTRAGKRTGFKYADAAGNTWVGMGKRPQWLRDALAAGKSLEDFLVSSAAKSKSADAAALAHQAGTKKRHKASKRAKYSDSNGNSWSGFGPKPRWLKDAIAGGKALEDFKV